MDTSQTPTQTFRHDGWTPARKTRFLDCLALKGNVRLACRAATMSPDSAYRLKRREPLFARGWAAALLLARDATEQVLADRALDGVEEKVFHRGELVDTRRKYDTRLLLAYMARLDRITDEAGAGADAARFDELLACLAGEVPAWQIADDGLPRVPKAGQEGPYKDGWLEDSCLFVDWACGPGALPEPGLPGNPLPAPVREAIEAAARETIRPAFSRPRTVSDVSASALALSLALAGRAHHAGVDSGGRFIAARTGIFSLRQREHVERGPVDRR